MIYFLVVVIFNECLYIGPGSVNLKLILPSQLARLPRRVGEGGGGKWANLPRALSYLEGDTSKVYKSTLFYFFFFFWGGGEGNFDLVSQLKVNGQPCS